MDLQTFIESSLLQIGNAVVSARTKLCAQSIHVVPTLYHHDASGAGKHKLLHDMLNVIEFDVAVTVSEQHASTGSYKFEGEAETKGLLKVIAADVTLKGDGTRTQTNETERSRVSRIKFEIPIYYAGGRQVPVAADAPDNK